MENIVKDLEPMLRELAEKLGTTSEYLWTIMIKQAFISGIISCLVIIGILSISAAYFCLGKYIHKKVNDGWDDEALIPFYIIAVIGGIIGAISLFTLPYNIATAFINPEYWALKELLSKLN